MIERVIIKVILVLIEYQKICIDKIQIKTFLRGLVKI